MTPPRRAASPRRHMFLKAFGRTSSPLSIDLRDYGAAKGVYVVKVIAKRGVRDVARVWFH